MKDKPHEFSRLAETLIGDFRGIPDETPARMRKRPTQDLKALIEEALNKHQIGREGPETRIREKWTDLVGPANAHYSHAAQIDPRGRLIVLAGHSVVRQELSLHRQTILKRIQQLPGCEGVRELVVRAG